jgi:hypothetical protein
VAKKKDDNPEGKAVRRAINGPDVDHDALIGNIGKWNAADRGRASSAAETRGDIGRFMETTGMNGKALSMLRTILKEAQKDEGGSKARDIIRSLEKGLPFVKDEIGGQSDMLDADAGDDAPDSED